MWAKRKKQAATKAHLSQIFQPETGKESSGEARQADPVERFGKRRSLGVGIVVLLLVAGIGAVLFQNRAPELPIIDGDRSVTEQIEVLSEDQLNLFVEAKINPKKDTNRAYARALILQNRNQLSDAELQYKQIDDAGVASRDMLFDYMYTAVRNNNPDTAVKVGNKIIDLIQSKSDIPQEDRDLEIRRLKAKLTDFEAVE